MLEVDVNPLAMRVIEIATGAAADYFRSKQLDPKSVDPGVLADALKHYIKASWDEALKDAKDAMDANMRQVAEMTFAATFRVAGIAAAKRVLGEIPA